MTGLRRFFYFIFACALLYLGAYTFAFADFTILDMIFSYVSYPFLKLHNKVITPINETRIYLSSQKDLQQQISKYKLDYEDLLAKNIELASCKEYFDQTKDLREFNPHYLNTKFFLTQIIFKNFDDKRHFFLIDAGSDKGISVDMVAVYKNCILGRVSQVFPYYSKITLITDKTCKIAAITSSGVQGICEGRNNLSSLSLSYVNHLKTIKDGELVISSGEGLIFPRGFGLGKITRFEIEGFNYNIDLDLLIDFKTINYCYILERGAQIDNLSIDNISEPQVAITKETAKIVDSQDNGKSIDSNLSDSLKDSKDLKFKVNNLRDSESKVDNVKDVEPKAKDN